MWALTAPSPAPLAMAPANSAMWGPSERLEPGIGTYCLTRCGKSSHSEIGGAKRIYQHLSEIGTSSALR